MNEEENELREELTRVRKLASNVQGMIEVDENTYQPTDWVRKVMMPILADYLEWLEYSMTRQGCGLPTWQRPKWLTEIEARGKYEREWH